MIRKMLTAILSLTCVLGAAAGIAACTERVGSGGNKNTTTYFEKPDFAVVSDLDFELNEQKTAYTVTGIGREESTKITIPDDYNYTDEVTKETKKLPVTAIAAEAFSSEAGKKIEAVYIGANVAEIGEGAFTGCNLNSITIPDNVRTIGTGAFSNCTNLYNINIGSGLTTIPESAFMNCRSVTKLRLPNTVTNVGKSAFENCTGIKTLTMSTGCMRIEDRAFYGCTGLGDLKLTSPTLRYIGESAFYGCTGLITADISGTGINEIGFNCFGRCGNLTRMTVPFVGRMPYEALRTQYGGNAGSTDMISEEVKDSETGEGVSYTYTIFGYIFGATNPGENNTQQYGGRYIPQSLKTVIVKGRGNEVIAQQAFANCYHIKELEISGVQKLGTNCFFLISLDYLVLGKEVNSFGTDIFYSSGQHVNRLYYGGTVSSFNSITGNNTDNSNQFAGKYYLTETSSATGWHWVSEAIEPYTDTNNNGRYDVGEPYTDTNGNGSCDTVQVPRPWTNN